ncbi:MAG: ATP-binding cassette domain-containing protein [Acidimicrobiia bacterium]|nr:ATP-binding cassette domain-containing protein [Acidimicrobiia bacterium]
MGFELREIHKHFGPVRANDGVNLSVASGELHGLLGENGAGKSTLMKVLSGFHLKTSGEILVDGEPVELRTPADAMLHGIGMLHQDPLVFLPFTVLDNFLIGSPGPERVNRREAARDLAALAERFDFSFDPDTPTRRLTVGERQQLEILRLLWLGARVLILDEPTTGISAPQRLKLFATLRELAADGMSVVFVSHKLEEVEELCERVTIIRAGAVVGERDLPCPASELVELMFGGEVEVGERPVVGLGPPRLVVSGLGVHDRMVGVEDFDLEVTEGEVIGLAGLEGSGQRIVLDALSGLRRAQAGAIKVGGRDLTRTGYRGYLAAGVQFLPAGRLEEGLVAGLTLTEHFVLAGRRDGFRIDWDGAREEAARDIAEHFIKGTPESTAESLSGGNQQRLLLAMLQENLSVLLMEHPTRGLDIESAAWVWEQLLLRREDGTAIVFASADLDELLEYSDRILVFFNGSVLAEVSARKSSVDELGHLIGGKVSR